MSAAGESGTGNRNDRRGRAAALAARAALVLSVTLTLIWAFTFFGHARVTPRDSIRDLDVYYEAAVAVARGQSPYVPRGRLAGESLSPAAPVTYVPLVYLYRAPFAAVLAPLAALPPPFFNGAWYMLLAAGLIGFGAALAWVAREPLRRGALLAGPLAVSPLLLFSQNGGQADVLVFAGCALGLVLALRSRFVLAAGVIAATAVVKPFPLLLLVPLTAAARSGKPLLAAAAWSIAAELLGWVALGTAHYGQFFTRILPYLSRSVVTSENFAPTGLLLRLGVHAGFVDPALPAPAWARITTLCFALLIVGFVIVLSRRLPLALSYSWTAGLATFTGGICWTSYWTLWLILAAAWWRERQTGDRRASGASLRFSDVLTLGLVTALPLFDAFWVKGPLTILWVFLLLRLAAGRRNPASELAGTATAKPTCVGSGKPAGSQPAQAGFADELSASSPAGPLRNLDSLLAFCYHPPDRRSSR